MEARPHLVVRAHRSEYPRPITFGKGTLVRVGRTYDGPEGWERWRWCSVPGQESGWVPEQVLGPVEGDVARALEDYTARELDVEVGETVVGLRALNGWVWCERPDGSASGWVPRENLREAGAG